MTLCEAIFAGGCFWCLGYAFSKVKGVKEVVVGYTGGDIPNPTYEDVCTGKTGHYEAVKAIYDPEQVSYKELLEVFWKNIDPTDEGGQFADRGPQYRTAIFYLNEEQRRLAEESKILLERAKIFAKPIVTKILPAKEFYPAEPWHQRYWERYRAEFASYHWRSGKDQFLKSIWSKRPGFKLFK
ncbi:peptide-methionine (S)-S-oxide reductase [Thermosulfidibacter takaii ABI70S6]|uniref:Peptide methionine sulfoxide reductase MsrA n=1 Tax=Thermosulfidibacter takaii (strain DSM 17441 / JCM 13301 / NBRC 103674 / ABI70S6) TaxID=1298851 RepID=A0A0S3QS34_THET7|nr:peptide-methionine (S)-S-oxide reductase [Thermosulfidibacter takaii ABI70S6]